MTLSEELYFDITVEGKKEELRRFASYLLSGDLDDFFPISDEYIAYDDEYASTPEGEVTNFVFTNDDIGIEIDEFDPEEFLDEFCRAGADLDLRGHLYDLNDEEYRFVSPAGDGGYSDASRVTRFNDELDEEYYEEESRADQDED